jgi:PKD repeat protein
MASGEDFIHRRLPDIVGCSRSEPLPGHCPERGLLLRWIPGLLIALLLLPSIASADNFVGGIPLTTVQSGTVTGDLWMDATPPAWAGQGISNITKTFTLPAAAVAGPGRIKWARLYVSAYSGHMQNPYLFTITNRWDGDGVAGYEQEWKELNYSAFHYIGQDECNDNSAFGGTTCDPYLIINDHETRVTSDYFMWYDVKDLIKNQTIFLNVDTQGSFDGRTKVATLVVAYDDPASTTKTTYWVNQGHDVCSYYTEDNFGEVAVDSTTFDTSGLTDISSATLTVDYMASHQGLYGFPAGGNDQDWQTPSIEFAMPLATGYDIQGPYSGLMHWDVTSKVSGSNTVSLFYSRDPTQTGTSAFYKIPLAVLVAKSPLPPVANFTANASAGVVPFAVQFNDTSAGSPTAWSWDFNGDGIADSTEQNASFTYTAAGTYDVTLAVTSATGSNTTVRRGFITATAPIVPVADFTNTTPRSGTAPLTVQFNDTSTGSPMAWNWTFGDGNTSTLQNASHTYVIPGAYSVNLSVTGPGGTNFSFRQNYVSVATLSGEPVAAFGASPLSGAAPLNVTFTDLSTGSPTAWSWDFNNDGVIDNTTQNPVYSYTSTGIYTVKLTTTNAYGSGNLTRVGYITVVSGNAAVRVEPAEQSVGIGETKDIRIILDSTRTGLAGYTLNVTLGNPEVGQITAVTYPSWVQLGKNPDVPAQSVLVGGADTGYQIEAGATAITLANITIRGNLTGITSVELRSVYIDDDNGDAVGASVAAGTIIIGSYTGPVANFTANTTSGPGNLTVQFADKSTNATTWAWDFNNDGTIDSTLQNPVSTYTIAGTYSVNLTVKDSTGSCHTLVRSNYITVTSNSGSVPIPVFSGTPLSGTAPLTVAFTDQSSGSPTAWTWDFGDSNTSSLKNPSHRYVTAGNYTVKLTATNGAGSNSTIRSNYVNVTAANSGAPVASFSASSTSGTVPLVVTFTDTSTNSPTSWAWNFGDGTTSSLSSKTITYTSAGVYTVTLTAANAHGSSYATKTITVNTVTGYPGVAFSATPTSGAVPLAVAFTDQSSGSPTAWEWDFDDDGTVDSILQNPSYSYSAAGTYSVKLTATNNVGSSYLTKSNIITATTSSTSADLTVSTMVPNLGSASGGSVFLYVSNPVTLAIKNTGTEASTATTVQLKASDGFSGTASVPAIAAGSNTTVQITDTTTRSTAGTSITYTATVDPDDTILETDETNNIKTGAYTMKYNGYMGKRYMPGGSDIVTRKTFDLNGSLVYSRGDSVYRSGSFGDSGWLSYTVSWTGTQPKVPANATVRAAYLYVPYTWDNDHIAPDHTFIDFNGNRVSRASWNADKSNFGVYADYEYGLLKYDVTSLYRKNAANSAVFTREDPGESDSARAAVYTKISMYEEFLVVVYEDDSETRKQIFINDNFDLLGASADYGTTTTTATAYIPFTGMTIDTADMTAATLITFVPSGDSNEGNILYNGNTIASNVWNYGGSGNGGDGIPQVAVDTRNVKSSIQATGNTFAIQSTDTGGTPCMAAIQQFLIIDLGGDGSSATTTTSSSGDSDSDTSGSSSSSSSSSSSGSSSTTTKSSTSATTDGSGSSTGSRSTVEGAGLGESADASGTGRYQAAPLDGASGLNASAGSTGGATANYPLDGLPPNLLIGCLFMIGATSVIAYRKGWIPPGMIDGGFDGTPGRCIWEGTGFGSCQIFEVESGIVRYRTSGLPKVKRTHWILIAVVLTGIVLMAAAYSSGFMSGWTGGSHSRAGNVQAGNFDIIPTVENIQDLDKTNHVPNYPAGFNARNGLLFVYKGTGKHAVADLRLELSKGANTVSLTSFTLPPSSNVVSAGFSTYFEEMGNGDGVLENGEWLMVYADNCYDSSLADGEPRGKVLTWHPKDSGTGVEVPFRDTIGYSLTDTKDGTNLQQGTVTFVPASP